MRIALFCLLLTLAGSLPGFALDKESILELATKPHSREDLVPELRIFTDAREFEVTLKLWDEENGAQTIGPLVVRERVVDGKYIVSNFEIPGAGQLVMALEFDRERGVYHKWIVPPVEDAPVGHMLGVSLPDTRCIAWGPAAAQDGETIAVIEHHTDKGATWKQITMDGEGKVLAVEEGTAVKTR